MASKIAGTFCASSMMRGFASSYWERYVSGLEPANRRSDA